MTDFYDLIDHEEGYRLKPYLCSEGYPTVGLGQRIGPKGASLSQYQFTVPRAVAEVWVRCNLDDLTTQIDTNPAYVDIRRALNKLRSLTAPGVSDYADPRICVLLSMCYQMGLDGVAKFKNTLGHIAQASWGNAKAGMLASLWAKQTPNRAKRHAQTMLNGQWPAEY
jgi:lysozyme